MWISARWWWEQIFHLLSCILFSWQRRRVTNARQSNAVIEICLVIHTCGVSVRVYPDAGAGKHWRLDMLVIMVKERWSVEGERKKRERWNEFPSLVKRRSRGVALYDDKQTHALCLPFLVCSQTTARPVASASYAAPMCVLNLCLAAYYQLFIIQISWGHEVRKHLVTSHFLQHIFKTWGLPATEHKTLLALHYFVLPVCIYLIYNAWVISASADRKTTFPKECSPCHEAVWCLFLVQLIYWQHCCWLVQVMPSSMSHAVMSNGEANHLHQTFDSTPHLRTYSGTFLLSRQFTTKPEALTDFSQHFNWKAKSRNLDRKLLYYHLGECYVCFIWVKQKEKGKEVQGEIKGHKEAEI